MADGAGRKPELAKEIVWAEKIEMFHKAVGIAVLVSVMIPPSAEASNQLLQFSQLDFPSRPDLGCVSMFDAGPPDTGLWELSERGSVSRISGLGPLGYIRESEQYPSVQSAVSATPRSHEDVLLRFGEIAENGIVESAMQVLSGPDLETVQTVRFSNPQNPGDELAFLHFNDVSDFSYVVLAGAVFRFDDFSPDQTWFYESQNLLINDIAVVEVGQGERQIAVADDQQLVFLNAESGEVVRSLPIRGIRKIIPARLLDTEQDQLLILNSDFDSGEFDLLRAIDADSLQNIWSAPELSVISFHAGNLAAGSPDAVLVARDNPGNSGLSLLDSSGMLLASTDMDPSPFVAAHFADIAENSSKEIFVSTDCGAGLKAMDQQLRPVTSYPDYGRAPYAKLAVGQTDAGRSIVYSFTSDALSSATPSFIPRLRAVDAESGELLWVVPLRSEDGLFELRPKDVAVIEDSSILEYGHRIVIGGSNAFDPMPAIIEIDPSIRSVRSVQAYPEMSDFDFGLLRTLRWGGADRLFVFQEPRFSSAGPLSYLILDTENFNPIPDQGGPIPQSLDTVTTETDADGEAAFQLWIVDRNLVFLADLTTGNATLLSNGQPRDARFITYQDRPAIVLIEDSFEPNALSRITILDRGTLEDLATFSTADLVYRVAQQGAETLLLGTGDSQGSGPNRISRFSLISGRVNASSELLGASEVSGYFLDHCNPDCVSYLGNARGIFEILAPPPELIFSDGFEAVLPLHNRRAAKFFRRRLSPYLGASFD